MSKRHKHADLIHAWAEGAEIEYLRCGEWVSHKNPSFHEAVQWRIKPKTVKKEGWVNVYKSKCELAGTGHVYATEEKANAELFGNRVACIRIEWEEEV